MTKRVVARRRQPHPEPDDFSHSWTKVGALIGGLMIAVLGGSFQVATTIGTAGQELRVELGRLTERMERLERRLESLEKATGASKGQER